MADSETAIRRFARSHPIESIQTWSATLLLLAVLATLAASGAIVLTRDTIAHTYSEAGIEVPTPTGFWLAAPEWLYLVLAGVIVVGLVAKEVRLRNNIHSMGVNASTALAAMTLLALYFWCMLLPLLLPVIPIR